MKFKDPIRKKNNLTPGRRIDYRKPCWQTFYWLGIEAARHLHPHKSFVEIGHALGLTPQNTNTACMVALGKVVFAMRRLRG